MNKVNSANQLVKKSRLSLLLIFLNCLFNFQLKAQLNLPANFTHTLLSSGWTDPVGITYDANGVGYLWEKRGKVWRVNANGIKQTPVLIDLSDEVGNWRAHGMLGFALDPNFITNGYIYCLYIVDRYALLYQGTPGYSSTTNMYNNATIGRVTRYQANPATNFTSIVAGSRTVLIGETKSTGFPILHESHGAGSLVFGKDGSLLVSFGDGADYGKGDTGSTPGTYFQQALDDSIITPQENIGSFRAQYLESLNGKILRIDPSTGNGLPSNPFYQAGSPRSARSRIWALGFRNPFRMSLDPNTGVTDITAGNPGLLIAGEVGWATWEETNVIYKGGNYGWPFFEGITAANTFPGYLKYNYSAPNPLYGLGGCTQQYFYFQNLIKQTSENASLGSFKNPCNSSLTIPANIPVFFHQPPALDWRHVNNYARVPVLGTDTVVADTLGFPNSTVNGSSFTGNCAVAGPIYNDNRFPVAYQGAMFQADYGELWIKSIRFDNTHKVVSVNSFADSVGSIVYMTIRPQDGCLTYITLPNSLHKICYTANINNPPTAKIELLSPLNYGSTPLTINFNGSLSTDPENQIISYLWNFDDGTTSTDINPIHTFQFTPGVPHKFEVKLTVTDDISQQSVDSFLISINNTPPQVNITSIADSTLYHITGPTYYDLIAGVTDSEHNDSLLTYEWQSVLHHNNHLHPEPKDNDHITSTVINPDGCDDVFKWEINLTVTDPEGLWSSDTVFVYPKCQLPDLDFTANKTQLCGTDTVTFTNSSFNGFNYLWSFSGGVVVSSNESQAIVVYSNPGSYSVSLSGCNKLGCDTLIKSSYIVVDSIQSITLNNADSSTICTGQSALLSTPLIASANYTWFKNSMLISGTSGNTYLATDSGNYMVKATSINGCEGVSNALQISVLNPIASLINLGKDSICPGTSTVLNAVAGGPISYTWYRNNILINGATDSVYTVTQTGTYKVVIGFANLCLATTNDKFIKVSSTIPATLSVNKPNPVCYNDSLTFSITPVSGATYTWKKNGVKVPSATGPSYSLAMKTDNNITAKIAKPGCIANTPVYNAIVSPNVTLSVSSYTICNDSALVSVPYEVGNAYKWKRNNVKINGAVSNYYYAKTDGGYNVTVTNFLNCTRTSSKANIVINCRNAGEQFSNQNSLIQRLNFEPNPAKDYGSLNFELMKDADLTISILDFMGKEVEKIKQKVTKGNFSYDFDLSKYSNGIYNLIIYDETGHSWYINVAVSH